MSSETLYYRYKALLMTHEPDFTVDQILQYREMVEDTSDYKLYLNKKQVAIMFKKSLTDSVLTTWEQLLF